MILREQIRERPAASFSAVETLCDGRLVEIRALRPTDRAAMIDATRNIGDAAMARRFFGAKRHFSETEVSYFVDVDFVTHVALVAVADSGSTIAGGGRYVLVRPGCAELAFAVTDAWQSQGLGGLLMRHLAAIARRAGLRELIAEILSDNRPMLRLLERAGLPFTTRHDGAITHATLQLGMEKS